LQIRERFAYDMLYVLHLSFLPLSEVCFLFRVLLHPVA